MEKDYLEMLIEEMNSKFDLVLEGQESLRKEMHGIRDDLSEKIDHNTFMIKALNTKIDGVEKRLDAKIDGVEQRLDTKIDNVESRLSKKIDSVAVSLDAHRRDTEAHRGYRVREE